MLNTKEGKTKKEIEKCPWIALWIHLSPSYMRTEENDDDMNHKERVGGGHLHCTGWVAVLHFTACQFGILLPHSYEQSSRKHLESIPTYNYLYCLNVH